MSKERGRIMHKNWKNIVGVALIGLATPACVEPEGQNSSSGQNPNLPNATRDIPESDFATRYPTYMEGQENYGRPSSGSNAEQNEEPLPRRGLESENAGVPSNLGENKDSGEQNFIEWLELIEDNEIVTFDEANPKNPNESLDYGKGYLTWYGPIETTGIENLIYNSLKIQKDKLSQNNGSDDISPEENNLLDLTGELILNPTIPIIDQTRQTPEIRERILNRVEGDQSEKDPEEALESGNVVGFIATRSPEDIGFKYLVYTQNNPGAELKFKGVVVAIDSATEATAVKKAQENYNFQGWEDHRWLADATGPFWENIPTGLSRDPSNTNEGRPGVFFIREDKYNELKETEPENHNGVIEE